MATAPGTPEAPGDAAIIASAALLPMLLTIALLAATLLGLQYCYPEPAAPSGQATPDMMETVR